MSLEDVEKIMDETAEAVKYQEVSIRDTHLPTKLAIDHYKRQLLRMSVWYDAEIGCKGTLDVVL